jgi:AcrR family transcriptional regulator
LASKTSYHHGNLRPALIAAALKEIAREGPDGFSLREVARRAGVSAPSVYRHFESKEDLLAAVAAECSERLSAAIAEELASAIDHPLEKFRARGIAIVVFAATNPEHFRALSLTMQQQDPPPEDVAAIAAAQRAGLITELPAEEVIIAASALVTGLAHMIVEGQLGSVDAKRARHLAISVTGVLGVGLIPRDEDVDDVYKRATVRGKRR